METDVKGTNQPSKKPSKKREAKKQRKQASHQTKNSRVTTEPSMASRQVPVAVSEASTPPSSTPKVSWKLDYGYKALLRGSRKSF